MEKKGTRLRLDTLEVDIEDKYSEYFDVVDFKNKFTGGKNSVSLNGTPLLKKGSRVQIEVLDVYKNPLYIEVGRSPVGSIKYRDGVSTVLSVHVTGKVPVGVGEFIIVGTTTNGETVRWRKPITIDSKTSNKDKVRFYRNPTLIVDPSSDKITRFSSNEQRIISGSVSATAAVPIEGTDYTKFDTIRKQTTYKVLRNSGDEFVSLIEGEIIKLSNIVVTVGGSPITDTFEAEVVEVVNDSQVILKTPFIYPKDSSGVKPVKNIISADYETSYSEIPEASIFTDGDGSPFLQSNVKITLKNIRTFTGNVSRIKLFRDSFQNNDEPEIFNEVIIEPTEILVSDNAINKFKSKLGFFLEDSIVDYWQTTTGYVTQSSDMLIDGMKISGSFSNSDYVIVKDNTASPTSDYISVESASMVSQSGQSWDSNFLTLFGGVEYELSGKVYNDRLDSSSEAVIEFFITGSEVTSKSSINFESRGVKLDSIVFPPFVNKTTKDFKATFSLDTDVRGTLVTYPYPDGFTVSKLSIKPKQAFSFSPDIFTTRCKFPLNQSNEKYNIRCEMFDSNNNSIPVRLDAIKTFDALGETRNIISATSNQTFSVLDEGDGQQLTFRVVGNDMVVSKGSTQLFFSGSVI